MSDGEIIFIVAKSVKATGLNKAARPNLQKLRTYFFQEEWERLALLKQLPQFPQRSKVKVLYPGCGADLFLPLFYLEQLFPQLQQAELVLVDIHNLKDTMKTLLDEVGISFSEEQESILFYWNNLLIRLTLVEGDVFELFPALPAFDLYFERAFRIMKDQHHDYEETVLEKLLPGGLVVSDSGFENAELQRFPVPSELSSYGEMVVGTYPLDLHTSYAHTKNRTI